MAHILICGERDVAERKDFDDEVTHACPLLLLIHGVGHAENKETNVKYLLHNTYVCVCVCVLIRLLATHN